MTDRPIQHADYERPGDLPPGFRVTAEHLSDEQAIQAMQNATRAMEEVALAERRTLLGLGFADDHRLCLKLDKTAGDYNTAFMVLRRQATEPPILIRCTGCIAQWQLDFEPPECTCDDDGFYQLSVDGGASWTDQSKET